MSSSAVLGSGREVSPESLASLPRFSFAKTEEKVALPDLVQLQKASYEEFLQLDVDPHKRKEVGLQGILKGFFPLEDFSGRLKLEFSHYVLETPKFDVGEARDKGVTHAAPLRVAFRLVMWEVDEALGTRTVVNVKEQDVYMGDIPLMTPDATFVVNGVERVVVSQVHRSPGVFFDHDRGRSHSSGKRLFSASVRPSRGSWMDIEFDAKDTLYARIDRKRKFLATTLLMALPKADDFASKEGLSREAILALFYDVVPYKVVGDKLEGDLNAALWCGVKLEAPLLDAASGKEVAAKGDELTDAVLTRLAEAGVKRVSFASEALVGRALAKDCVDAKTGEVLGEAGDELTSDQLAGLLKAGVSEIPLLAIDHVHSGGYVRDTLMADKNGSRQEALFEIYRILRPGDPPTFDAALKLFREAFFDNERYDLSDVGRVKTNLRLGLSLPEDHTVLSKDDLVGIVRVLIELCDGRRVPDDVDSLSNRRARAVGEMLAGHYQAGLMRLERSIRERMSNMEADEVMPQNILNAKPLAAVLRDFFSGSQLSQLMDQTNPLSEVTHKRRLSALGPGGLAKERASLEARDVHPTHYGRICPVETPEGQSIGLINSMACYASVDRYGFIKTPYARVVEGCVTDEVVHLSALEEEPYHIAQGNAGRDGAGKLTDDVVSCRLGGEYVLVAPGEVDFIDVSPKQVLSVAAALIPFVENDDASRALMGANMQRQAVPLLVPEAPLVGTGMERPVACDSGSVLLAKRAGVVSQVDAERIVVVADEAAEKGDVKSADAKGTSSSGVDIYRLRKFRKTNAGTCINQRPIVNVGQRLQAGQVIADGLSTEDGELALGRNVLVAFMPWHGYGFEDSIVVSERLVQRGDFTSVHIEELEVSARDTKQGSEEITRDVPGASTEMLNRLDESGIVYVGAEVKPGDILVGKVTPKGDSPMTAEEKLLRAIFGEKAVDMRDTSLRLPSGVRGTVVDVRVLSRRGLEKDERALAIERTEVTALMKERDLEIALLQHGAALNLRRLLLNQTTAKALGKTLQANEVLTEAVLADLPYHTLSGVSIADEAMASDVALAIKKLEKDVSVVEKTFTQKAERVRQGDELPSGVLKTVKIYVAVKRDLKVGDKMAGRHGNKGVVSKIVPIEDMPYLEDGTPVDMLLNPLGVPSRMNVGQILEAHLGCAARGFGLQLEEHLKKVASSETLDADGLRAVLKKTFATSRNAGQIDALVDGASEDQLVAWALKLDKGVPMQAPVFEGAKISDVTALLGQAGQEEGGQFTLYDGRTGEAFDRKITVGVMYMLKLHHLVEQKIHARSVGPYSLITQQPLGGKAQFGGQRLGEMEVWALEGYGAAYTLREMLTVKSDDTVGRTAAYEAIVRGDSKFECGIPASFSVLFRELLGLCLDVEFLKKGKLVEQVEEEPEDELRMPPPKLKVEDTDVDLSAILKDEPAESPAAEAATEVSAAEATADDGDTETEKMDEQDVKAGA